MLSNVEQLGCLCKYHIMPCPLLCRPSCHLGLARESQSTVAHCVPAQLILRGIPLRAEIRTVPQVTWGAPQIGTTGKLIAAKLSCGPSLLMLRWMWNFLASACQYRQTGRRTKGRGLHIAYKYRRQLATGLIICGYMLTAGWGCEVVFFIFSVRRSKKHDESIWEHVMNGCEWMWIHMRVNMNP